MDLTSDIRAFADRYVAVWNEPDPTVRRGALAALWAGDAAEFTNANQYRGHAAIEARITAAYEEFVKPGRFVFTSADDAVGHHDAVTFTTHMVPTAGGTPVWTGVMFAALGADGRMTHDYQFTGQEADTQATVAEFLHRLAEGDPNHIAEMFAATVDWQLDWPAEGHPSVPWIRPRSTRADIAEHFAALNALHLPGQGATPPPNVVARGRDAVVLGEIRQTVKASGRPYVARYALHLSVEDSLITRYHVYEDSLTVAQALAQ